MITLIQSELLKLKRSYMLLLCLLGSTCAPFLNFLIFASNEQYTGVKPEFTDFMEQSNMFIAILIGILLYSLFTTYVIEREFTEDMLKHLFSIPISKANLLISKLVIISLGLFAMTFTQTEKIMPLTVGIFEFVGDEVVEWTRLCAVGVFASMPSIIFFIFAQRYVVQGLTAGAIKE